MATVRLVIAVLVPDAAHAMQDMCQMPPQDYVLVVLPTPTLHLLAIWHALHVCFARFEKILLNLSLWCDAGDGNCQAMSCSASAGCSSCNAGYVPNAMTGLCDGCTAGQYAAAGDSACSSCTSGTDFSFANAGSCTPCLL